MLSKYLSDYFSKEDINYSGININYSLLQYLLLECDMNYDFIKRICNINVNSTDDVLMNNRLKRFFMQFNSKYGEVRVLNLCDTFRLEPRNLGTWKTMVDALGRELHHTESKIG